jgi:GT2 family glycosyltransferase
VGGGQQLAILILNRNGRHHLGPCLEAALALAGLPGPGAVVVADNGSTDGSREWVAARHPGVTWLPFDTNLGFAEGNNRAARAIEAEWLLFLNNDTAIAPDALERLRMAATAGVACAGARLVSWDGRWLDFDGGGASFTGHGHALGIGQPVPRGPAVTRPTLFASGAAMLVRREVFLGLGGFDPGYFAYYEDVDLGWRLWLAGQTVVHVPDAVVRHRHHGTAGAVSDRAARLYERNALATVTKVYADEPLARVLPAALALAAVRAGADATVIDQAVPAAGQELPLPAPDWAGWPYLAGLALDWPALAAARAAVQATRRRPDAEVLAHLARPRAPAPATAAMRVATDRAIARFGLTDLLAGMAEQDRGVGRARLARLVAAGRLGGPAAVWRSMLAYRHWRTRGSP